MSIIIHLNKRQRIPKGQSNMNKPEKLARKGMQDEGKQSKTNNTICVGHHYRITNTNNLAKT